MKVINYNGIDWFVLDKHDGKTLILTKDIIEKHRYNVGRFCAAWDDSTLHAYLDGEKFKVYLDYTKQMFGMLEFDVRDVVVVTGTRTNAASEQAGLGDTLKSIGAKLVK
jgi:hypothetical protein